MTLDFSETSIENMIVHAVGNKANGESIVLSAKPLPVSGEAATLLAEFFLAKFTGDTFYNFAPTDALATNKVFQSASTMFESPDEFVAQSAIVAQWLYEQSTLPNIKSGELYVTLFRNCMVEDEVCDAIGIFKFETKETFVRVVPVAGGFDVRTETGANIQKIDKGCIVFNTEKHLGYKVCILDASSKKGEALYWRDGFLQVQMRNDNFYQTQNYLNLCKSFVEEVYNEENNVEKAGQAELLNKSIGYFKEKENFDIKDFEQTVMNGDNEVITAFKQHKQQYQQEQGIALEESFDISEAAVKKEQRKFKTVLKLDRNFHVYIHGDQSRIQKGFDDGKKMNFYQLYYETEQ